MINININQKAISKVFRSKSMCFYLLVYWTWVQRGETNQELFHAATIYSASVQHGNTTFGYKVQQEIWVTGLRCEKNSIEKNLKRSIMNTLNRLYGHVQVWAASGLVSASHQAPSLSARIPLRSSTRWRPVRHVLVVGTVRATTADSPDRGPSGLGAGPSALLFLELNNVKENFLYYGISSFFRLASSRDIIKHIIKYTSAGFFLFDIC
jgi:hypothetical protein